MERLNEILKELGISKVKLAKFLGVSRQMIYNYLELDDLNKWPKDKKVLLLNLLGIKSADELKNIKGSLDDINFGSQIRSYIMCPYTLVKDHRTNVEVTNVNSVLDGNIDVFINSILKEG